MIEAISRAHAFAPAAIPIVLYGESGSGKTFFADYIHQVSQRAGGFNPFSVGTVAPQLALDELFGHVQGAYTDARKMRTGRIATAGGGTLLLDDVQNLDLGVQKQLLQVLDRGTYSPVGSDRVLTVACRIMLAMSDGPGELMKKGLLLKDLRYRFGACAIRIPPLRERREEIPLLARRALERCPQATMIDGPTRFSDAALALLCEGEYEGNVRELGAVVEYGYLMARAAGAREIGTEHMPAGVCPALRYRRRGDREANGVAVERALKLTGGNVSAAARLLGISRNAFNAMRARTGNAQGVRPSPHPIA
jgi:DNA-binding NtrC family response regulator